MVVGAVLLVNAWLFAAAPAPPDTQQLDVVLTEPAAATYGEHAVLAEDSRMRALLAGEPGVSYEPALAHAARELARFQARNGTLAPIDVVRFYLSAGGAVAIDTHQSLITTSERGFEPVVAIVRQMRRKNATSPLRVGVGETADQRGRRSIAVVATHEPVVLAPLPRRIARGDRITISGVLATGTTEPLVEVMRPSRDLAVVRLTEHDGRFTGQLDTASEVGEYRLEMSAVVGGTRQLFAQLLVYAGVEPPTQLRATPVVSELFATVEQAEQAARARLDADRQLADLPPLAHDPALASMARSHCNDMRDGAYVGHDSPRFGDLEARSRSAGVTAVAFAENVAKNASIAEAQASLMRSIGHRRNLLDSKMTHVGVGVARANPATDGWYVTQVFARRPKQRPEPDERAFLLTRMNRERARKLRLPLVENEALSLAATRLAALADVTPADVLAAAVPDHQGKSTAVIQAMSELDSFDPPERCVVGTYRQIGIGISHDRAKTGVTVVLVLTD